MRNAEKSRMRKKYGVRLTVTGNDGNTYYFVLNTVYQA